MLLKLVNLRGSEGVGLEKAARQVSAQGKESICLASDLLAAKDTGEKEEPRGRT
jgi:hypothetical protein